MIYYFISSKNFDNQILYPRIPKNIAHHENYTIQRVCVSSSLIGCIMAVGDYDKNKRIYVHSCNLNNDEVVDPVGVEDAFITGEKWAIVPVQMHKEYILHVNVNPINEQISCFDFFDKDGLYNFRTYGFDYKRFYGKK